MVLNIEYSLISVIVVSLLSLVGITTLFLNRDRMDVIIHYLLSFAIGTLLATTFFELLPEAVELEGNEFTPFIGFILIFTLAISFLIEKLINWHHHHDSSSHSHLKPNDSNNDSTPTKLKSYV